MISVFPLASHPLPLDSIETTITYAQTLSPLLQKGDMLTFSGELGSGKSTFIRAMIHALSDQFYPGKQKIDVPSPTFTLVQSYTFPCFTLSHYDLYRLEDSSELLELGVEEMFPSQISCIEWPDRLGDYILPNHLGFYLQTQETQRFLQLFCLSNKACHHWQARLRKTSFLPV